jgi:uncharacterized protein
VASRIIREQIVPSMRSGRVAEGLTRGAEAIARAATGQMLPAPVARTRGSRPPSSASGLGCVLVFFALIVFSAIRRAFRPRIFGYRQPLQRVPWWMWLLIGQGTRPQRSWYSSSSSHRRHSGWGGGGGSWGGGGGSSGGFGGGSFGGGGASGGW